MSAPPPVPMAPPGGDENRGTAVEVVTWVFTAIALITVFLRIFGRLRLTRNPGWDDFWIVLAMVFNLTYTALIVVAVNAGNGRHPYYLGMAATSNAIKWNSIAFIPGIMSFAIPKLGVAVLLMRLMNPSKTQRYIMYFLSCSCIVWSSLCAIFLWQQCKPSAGLWNPGLNPKCWDPSILINYSIFAGAFSACTDIYLAVYPCFVLYKLNISMQKKIGLTAVLSLGFVAGIIAIYKCTRLPELYNHEDYTYATVDLLIWTSVESSFIIIAANLPTLRPVFLLATGRSLDSQGRSIGHNHKPKRSDYKLSSLSKDSNSRSRGGGGGGSGSGPKDMYPTDTVDLVAPESVERILPPNRIRRTYDVEVNGSNGEGKGPGAYMHQFGGV